MSSMRTEKHFFGGRQLDKSAYVTTTQEEASGQCLKELAQHLDYCV